MRAVRFHEYGGPDVLQLDEVPDPVAGPDEVLVEVTAVGLNYGETLQRSGAAEQFDWLPRPELPKVPGYEVAGVVRAVGDGVSADLVGKAVVGMAPHGGYVELAVLPAAGAIELPEGIDPRQGLALLVQGVSALALAETAAIRPGERVLVEAAAGGVGSLLVQLVRRAGGTVVAAARGSEKLAIAKELGADEVVDYGEADWSSRVAPVDVALSSVGGQITRDAFELLRDNTGRLVLYGVASGVLPDITPLDVFRKGVALIGLRHLGSDPEYLVRTLREAFTLTLSGELVPQLGQSWPLSQAADAHRAFESRSTTGKLFLVP